MHFNCMPVEIRGVLYPSQKAAAKALGVCQSSISQRLRVKGCADTVGLGLAGGPVGNKNRAKKLALFGVTFQSRTEAAQKLGITRSQLTKWISPKASKAQKQMLVAAVMQYRIECDKTKPRSGRSHCNTRGPAG